MDGKILRSFYRPYSEQHILKMSVQLVKSSSKYLFSKAKISCFEKTSFKLMATEIIKLKLHYLNTSPQNAATHPVARAKFKIDQRKVRIITKNTDKTRPPARTFLSFMGILTPLTRQQHMEIVGKGSINDLEQKFVFLRSLQVFSNLL